MRRRSRILAVAASLLVAVGFPLFAYDPPAGAAYIPLVATAGGDLPGLTVTALDSPWADRLNPAASGGQQRAVLAAGYEALAGLGDASGQGLGTALALGFSLPKAYGVWGGGLRFVSTPAAMSGLPLGTFVTASASLSKALFPELLVGAGFDLSLGANQGSYGWGAVLDLGFVHLVGDLGPLLDFRWGGVLSGLGKGYSTHLPVNGAFGTAVSSYPSSFTLTTGAEALFVRTKDWKIGAGATLSFPSFQDLALYLSGGISFRDVVSLRTSWGIDLRELIAGESRSLIPGFVLSASIPLSPKAATPSQKGGLDMSELEPTLVARPLYDGIWGLGASAVIPIGSVDRKPPVITVKFPASEWGPAYISPNSDGVKDGLAMPVTITDERYLASYSLVVYSGDRPNADPGTEGAVRTIANKESRPETSGIKGLWARLTYVQKGLPVPESLSWDGRADDGSVVPDGIYSIVIQAFDDNGNRGVAGPFKVIVDNSPPQATVSPADAAAIFSPDGDGNKDSLLVRLSGSPEDLWTLKVLDAAGTAQRAATWNDSSPADFTWDGKADSGSVVPDGVYSMVLSSTDRAGNPKTARLDNIIVNTQQPPVNVTIDLAAFSPNGDGSKDILGISPSVPVRSGLVSWKLAILDSSRAERWSVSGTDPAGLPARLAYDGKTSSGTVLPEGQYQAELTAIYSNGHNPKALSPLFTVDLTPPSGTVKADRTAFNPTGSAGQNKVVYSLSGSKEEAWKAVMAGADGAAVRTWSMGPQPDATVEWDGADDQGRPVPDGIYSLSISAMDRAGNSFQSAPITVSLDTEKKAVRVAADQRAFSPNGDGQKDTVKLTVSVLAKDKLKSFELTVEDAESQAIVRSWKGTTGLADSYTWDGTAASSGAASSRAPDGHYLARIKVTYQNGDAMEALTPAFVLDTVAPTVKVSASPLLFSPNGDGRADSVAFDQTSSAEDSWQGRILAADGSVVRSWTWKGQAADFSWDGTDEAGNAMKDGAYRYDVQAVDAAGNKAQATVTGIALDNRAAQVFITASDPGLSPNGDGFKDTVSFAPIVNLKEGIQGWKLALVDKSGKERRVFSGTKDIPARIEWDGKDDKGAVVQDEFTGVFTVDYAKGDRPQARTGAILVDVDGPAVRISTSPELFSPDNDGVDDELTFSIGVGDASEIAEWRLDIDETAVVEGGAAGAKPAERLFISWGGKGAPAPVITWDGRSAKGELVEAATDYPWYLTIKDSLGNVSKLQGKISVDVLVIRQGDRLIIKVPSIVFRAGAADFVGLDGETVDRNAKVIKRIAQILNRFRDYRIRIEGHANSEGKIVGASSARIAEEETKELLPLSLGRAELVRKLLVENGVDPARLSTAGLGSSMPVVDFKDSVNRWKNRRVEFILIKN
jgi:flagellar hook assembly protein FlgD/outer membrane protein OmpA-like peptidoglycan-associated protein